MLTRIAQVAWWTGLFVFVYFSLVAMAQRIDGGAVYAIIGAVLMMPFFGVSYVLGGSFWLPPKKDNQLWWR